MQLRSESSAVVARAADGLRRIVQALRLSAHVIERAHGVTGAQLFVLRELEQSDGLSLAELAARTRTDPSSVSVAVSRLLARRLVQRRRASDDARRAVVRVVPKGRALLASAPEPAQLRLIRALESLPRAETARLAAVLEKIARSMGASPGAPPMFFEEARQRPRERGGRARS